MTDELKKEFTLKITRANATELVVILYDMILVYIKEAGEFWEEKNKDGYLQSLRKIRNCIGELMESLNLEYEMARKAIEKDKSDNLSENIMRGGDSM